MSDDLEKIYDEAPTEPEAGAETTEVTEPAETTEAKETPAKSEVIDELVEGTTPEAKEKPEPEPEPPEPTEQELAEAALKETEPPPEKETVPLAKYMAEKSARREAEDRATRAEGAAEALKKPAEPKPMSVKDLIEMGKLGPDDVVTAEHWAELETNRAEAAQSAAEPKSNRDAFLERATKSEEEMIAETTVEKVGEGLDYETVVAAGKGNLSVRDQAEIVKAEKPCRTLYELCLKRTPELAQKKVAVSANTKEGTKTAPKKKEPKNAPIPKGTAEQQAASADAEVEFMEAEMAKPDDQQLQEIRELSNAPAG